ncbi:unnamed protein product [Citrullus colocynthis]|uniref:Uncharacterized protein n=1 Tax=Citrullus colocynthis TaxID=252529 RepID=A0ABP0XS40_9ROSI
MGPLAHDYVIRRRIEKKLAAAAAEERQPEAVTARRRISDKEKGAAGKNGFRFPTTAADNVVFNCFSA